MSNFSAVGLRWQAVFDCQIVWNRSTRRAELPSQSPLYRFIRERLVGRKHLLLDHVPRFAVDGRGNIDVLVLCHLAQRNHFPPVHLPSQHQWPRCISSRMICKLATRFEIKCARGQLVYRIPSSTRGQTNSGPTRQIQQNQRPLPVLQTFRGKEPFSRRERIAKRNG